MHLSFCEWKVGFYCVVKLEWSWFPFVYMASFLDPRPAAVGDLVQQKLSKLKNSTHLSYNFILLDMDSIQYFKQNDQVLWRRLFIWACEGLSIHKALHIDVWEMAGVTAMAAGGEQTQSAHACDVSLGARIRVCFKSFQYPTHTDVMCHSSLTDFDMLASPLLQFRKYGPRGSSSNSTICLREAL